MNVRLDPLLAEQVDANASLSPLLSAQQRAFDAEPYPDLRSRLQTLGRLAQLVERNRWLIADAVSEDYGFRAPQETQLIDVNATLGEIQHLRSHLRKWMRPERRGTSIWFMPGGNRVLRTPLGVVGVMAPWNYPVNLALAPAAAALAAGNRVMLKMSEFVPSTTALMKRLISENFASDQFAVVSGDASVSAAFAELPFGHLFFTGSGAVGQRVMQAAARHMTPVTLELGGKSPAIVDASYPLARAADRITWGKLFNAGQTCVAPDYALVPAGTEQAFVDAALKAAARMSPPTQSPPATTTIVNEVHHARLQRLVDEAAAAGARVYRAAPAANKGPGAERRMPLTLVVNPPADCRLMTEELFGPVLPVIGVTDLTEAMARVNAGDAPLALYYFGDSSASRRSVLRQVRCGGVTFNDTLLHYLQNDVPFGGVGASGFGSYHGREGFDTFSHKKAVFIQRGAAGMTGTQMLYPPFGKLANFLIVMMRKI